MRKFAAVSMVVLGLAVLATAESTGQDKKDGPKYTISDVMQQGHKGGLLAKVTSGKATKEEKAELLVMYECMAKEKPPAGSADSWKKKTDALVAAAKLVVDGDKDKGIPDLKKATDCKGCHSVHKGA